MSNFIFALAAIARTIKMSVQMAVNLNLFSGFLFGFLLAIILNVLVLHFSNKESASLTMPTARMISLRNKLLCIFTAANSILGLIFALFFLIIIIALLKF